MAHVHYQKIEGRSIGFLALLAALGALIAAGLGAALYMEHNGHWVTGMSNQVIWGTPHVFALFLIVAASGALNVASIASVFGRQLYKPLARLSGLLAIALLAGGLAVLVLDLGRPERLILASSLYAPMFIIMSFAYGLAIFLLVLFAATRWTGRPLGDVMVARLKNLLGVFVASVLYFVVAYHLTNLYMTGKHDVERFILLDGGIYTRLFWIGQILIGGVLPLVLLFSRLSRSRAVIALAAILVIAGGLVQMYVTIVGGQAAPTPLFPGKEVSSSFFDGVVAQYSPSLPEVLLGIGGIGIALGLAVFAIKILPFLPQSLADADVDPHYKAT